MSESREVRKISMESSCSTATTASVTASSSVDTAATASSSADSPNAALDQKQAALTNHNNSSNTRY